MMRKINLLVMFMLFFITSSFCQSIPSTTTYYSKTKNGAIGSDEKTFYLSDGYMYKIDDYYKTKTSYGPLELNESGYSGNGFYYEFFLLDILSDPKGALRKKLMAYRVLYDEKGGVLLAIVEIKGVDEFQTFYTKEGYNYSNNTK